MSSHVCLNPQFAARTLHSLCQHIPSWHYGAVGADNALRLTAAALQQAATAQTGRELAVYAWAQHPLHPQLLHIVRQLHKYHSDPALAAAAPLLEYLHTGTAEQREEQAHLSPPLAEQAALLQARAHAQTLADNSPQAPETLKALTALAHALTPQHPWLLWTGTALAHYHLLHGDSTRARDTLRPVWEQCPYHPNLVLALYDLTFPLPSTPPASPPPALLLYSWNKAAVLADTLQSLRASDIGDAPVIVLDNGSTDGTANLLTSLRDQWGEQLHSVRLPVNIGAPAARNWLLALPEVRQHDNIVFLDDDLLLERDWLHRLHRVASAHPEADTIGCRIVSHVAPHAVQCADFFLQPPDGGEKSFIDIEEHIFLHCASMGSVDGLLSTYTRPCLSVSGCCHWIRTRSLASHGAFDVRFNPSQFDDAERDLRTVLHGGTVLYTGQVSVRHVQHSSLKQAHDRAKTAHIFGNKLKLEFLYDRQTTERLRQHTDEQTRQDLIRKITRLASTGGRASKEQS